MAHYVLGIDIGSTTAKLVLMDGDNIVYQKYHRHFSRVRSATLELLREMREKIEATRKITKEMKAQMRKDAKMEKLAQRRREREALAASKEETVENTDENVNE